jgi:transcriptional regulator with XRE-family HTH domain
VKKNTADRLREIMDARNLKQADIVRLCQPYAKRLGIKFQKSALSQYLSGRNEPNQYKLTVLALALNVSEAWLMGYDVPMERKEITTDKDLTDGEKLLLSLFRQIPEEMQDVYLEMLQVHLKNRK